MDWVKRFTFPSKLPGVAPADKGKYPVSVVQEPFRQSTFKPAGVNLDTAKLWESPKVETALER